MPFETKRFELTLPTNGGVSVILIGASRSGKTTMLKHLYREHFTKYITTMFSMNRHADIYKDLDDKVMVADNDPEITRALTIYRNAGISSIFSFQGRTLMSAVGRNNANYIIVFKQQTPLEYENVIKEFLSMYLPTGMTMKEMVQFVMLATQDHQFFVIDNIEGKCYLSKLTKAQAGL